MPFNRSRMLSIRLSSEEYEELNRLAEVSRARSLSELARQALKSMLLNERKDQLSELSVKVSDLDREVAKLSKIVKSMVPLVLLVCGLARAAEPTTYLLGPGDQVTVHVLDLEEIGEEKPFRIDMQGDVKLPLAGRIHAAGLSIEQLEAAISAKLKRYLVEPTVTVAVAEFRSQPVSVLGSVNTPGVLQIQGHKTLFEVLSQAGGLKPDAGNDVVITRQKRWGAIPLANAKPDPSGEYSIAQVSVKSIMSAKNPDQNIMVQPDDVISVPKADLIYVIGAVKRPGGYVLNEKAQLSVVEALSLAEGFDKAAATNRAKILHTVEGSPNRAETLVDVKSILAGKSKDLFLTANDILYIPTSATKQALMRGTEAAIGIGTGLAIYHP